MLRHEVAVLRRQVVRPALRLRIVPCSPGWGDCSTAGVGAGSSCSPRPCSVARDLVRRKWSHARRPGRPSIPAGTVAIIVRLARENPTWGYRRIQGELARMGVVLAPSSVWAILRRNGIDPSPMRSSPTWSEFLCSQASSMLACDSFSVDTVLLKRFYVLFFIELDTRRVYVTGVTAHPSGSWVVQQARNLTMALEDRVTSRPVPHPRPGHQVHSSFDEVFRADGIRIIRTRSGLPGQHVRRTLRRDVRRECLDRMLILGRRHLGQVLAEYIAHYNGHRPHRGPWVN